LPSTVPDWTSSHNKFDHRLDDEIYEHAISSFPELSANNHAGFVKLDEDWMKSEDGKKRWREFVNVSVSISSCFAGATLPIMHRLRLLWMLS
jgi:hypothetical protein